MLIHGYERKIEPGADLSFANLYNTNLHNVNLSGADLRVSNLSLADLRHADLSGANLSGAYLCGADLNGAYLYGACLRDANLKGVRLHDTAGLMLIGTRSDGYDFYAVQHDNTLMIKAGCHWFTLAEAYAHWSTARPIGTQLGDESRMILDHGVARIALLTKHGAWSTHNLSAD